MNNIIKKLRKIISDEKIKELTNTNISAILNQKDIYPDEPTKIKLGIFG